MKSGKTKIDGGLGCENIFETTGRRCGRDGSHVVYETRVLCKQCYAAWRRNHYSVRLPVRVSALAVDHWLYMLRMGMVALACLLFAACVPRGVTVGELGMRAQQGLPRGTEQPCVDAQRSVCIAETAVRMAARAIGRSVPEESVGVGVCLIAQPEPCCMGGWCVGPQGPGKLMARKAGCTGSYLIWAARLWPPVCTSTWPNEPHCVASPGSQKDLGYSMLVHESVKWLLDRYAMVGPSEEMRAKVDEGAILGAAVAGCAP